MLEQEVHALEDVMESLSDALLTAAGAILLMSGEDHVNIHAARSMSIMALDKIIDRTIIEGAKPQ